MASTTTIHTFCSGCGEDLRVNTRTLTVTFGRKVIGAVELDGLYEWECPFCGYADSLHPASAE